MDRIKNSRRRTKIVALAVILVAIIATSIAAAAWLTGGNGTARGKAGALQALVVTASTAPVVDEAYPGLNGNRGDANVTVQNPNSGDLVLISAQNTGALSSSDNAGCPSSNLTWGGASPTIALPSTPIAGGASVEIVLDDVVQLDANAPNECQGVSINVPVRINARTP